jgi:hypothetical protein
LSTASPGRRNSRNEPSLAYHYRVYGLSLHANAAIPGLVARPDAGTADARVWLQSLPAWADAGAGEPAPVRYGSDLLTVTASLDAAHFMFRYTDGSVFAVDGDGSRIWTTWPDAFTAEDMATYLLGPILGFVLRLRDVCCLHASAVAVGGAAVALLGPGDAGKSTTAAALAAGGHSLITEDVLPLVEGAHGWSVRPGYPQVRLWPPSVAALYGHRDALPPLTPNWDKRGLELTRHGLAFQEAPLPLRAIYYLGPRADVASPSIEPMPPAEQLLAVARNSYAGYLLDRAQQSQHFAAAARLVQRVPVRLVTPCADLSALPRLCDAIVEDVRSLATHV